MELLWTAVSAGDDAPAGEGAEAALIGRAVRGDRDAFAALVQLHQARVFRLAGRFFRRREDLEEAAQETFLTAWRRLSTYRAEAPFEHWLTRLCLRTCYRGLKQMRRPPHDSLDFDRHGSGGYGSDRLVATPTDPNAALELAELMKQLSPSDRFVLLLLDGEGWTVAEIAKRIGWSQSNVKIRAFRARARLRRWIEAGGES